MITCKVLRDAKYCLAFCNCKYKDKCKVKILAQITK